MSLGKRNALALLLDAIKAYNPQKVILFGSAARGEADAESDLDVLVFVARVRCS